MRRWIPLIRWLLVFWCFADALVAKTVLRPTGVAYGTTTGWKLYGPDLNGTYGGMNGVGGLDGVSPYLNTFNPVISDSRGDILAEVTNGVARWFPSRPTGFGAVPRYRPVALGHGADVAQASAWRGKWADITGYYSLGLRVYDPIPGMWLSYDSVVDPRNPNGCSAFGGDPINGFDSDGRFSKGFYAGRNEDDLSGDANSAFTTGMYYGSTVHGFAQGMGEGIDNVWNLGMSALFYNPGAGGSPQDFVQNYPLASPMKNWFNVNYGDNAAGNEFAATFGPLTQNAINSFGVSETTAETPTVDVPEPNYNGPQTGFYVTPNGTAVPATGYRAISGSAVTEAQTGVIESRNPTYLTFDNITGMSPSGVQDLLQLPGAPSHVATFDTLQMLDNCFIPTVNWNTGTTPEPFAVSNPQWGGGGGSQAGTTLPIQGYNLAPLTGSVNAPPNAIVPFQRGAIVPAQQQ